MYYELYIDVFFLVNFMMNYILLLLLRRILKCTATHGRICIGALLGALLTCIVVSLPIPYAFIKFILFHIIVNTGMIKLGLKIKNAGMLIKAWLMLYVSGFFLGGIMEYMGQYVRVTSFFLAVAIGGYYIALGLLQLFAAIIRNHDKFCTIDLYVGEHVYQVKALIDTGNCLVDPVSKEPVHIIDKKVLKVWEDNDHIMGMRFISYHTIGEKEGIIPIVRLDKMCVHRKNSVWIQRPIVGLCKERISQEGDYKMILNPEIL